MLHHRYEKKNSYSGEKRNECPYREALHEILGL